MLVIKLIIMCGCSIAILYSTALGNFEPWALKQLITLLIFIPIVIITALVDFKIVLKCSYWLYGVSLLMLLLAAAFGHKAMGAQRWLRIGAVNFQPSELMKLGLILALARYYYNLHANEIGRLKHLIIPAIMIVVPVLFIIKQPNLGTATILIGIAVSMMFTAGLRLWKFVVAIIITLIALPLVWMVLHDYQRQRVMTFINPEADPMGAGYNIIQSIIAIGSGGLSGKGFLKGSQSQLSFLPEKQTDFILSVIGEEFGFIGVSLVFCLTIGIIFLCYRIAFTSSNHFFRLIVIGVTTSFALHAIINAGMIAGLLPVVGTPYPLLSYGGSNLAVFLLGFALVFNKKLRAYKN